MAGARRVGRSAGMLLLACVLAVMLTASAPVIIVRSPLVATTPQLSGPQSVAFRPDVAYGPLEAERLDLCLPVGARALLPGVVILHGGAWRYGNRQGFEGYCRAFASRGFVAATIDYRLAPRSIWPAQLVDAQLAVRFLRAHAATFSLDGARLCGFGESAGGQLAAFLGVLGTIHPGDEASLYPNVSPRVSCVVDLYGPVDLTRPLPLLDSLGTFTTLFGGQTREVAPALYRDASPLYFVTSAAAPTLIIQGEQDTTVPPEQSRLFDAALTAAGVAVQYVSYDGGHGIPPDLRPSMLQTEGDFLLAHA